MKYFISVVDFVDKHILWVVGLFLLASIIEFIVFLCIKNGGKFNTDGLFICIVTNLIVTLVLYILACLGVGLVNCLMDQDYHFWSNYLKFLNNGGSIILVIVFIVSVIYFAIKLALDSVGDFIGAVILAALTTGVAFIAGLLIYIVISLVIIILKVLWFVISGFFISMFEFVLKYWKMSILVLLSPGVIYGAGCALVNYIKSFKKEVVHK